MDTHHPTTDILSEALGLSEIIIESVKFNSAKEMIIEVVSTRQDVLCRQCGRITDPHGRGRELTLRHLPIFGKPTYIKITPRRGICQYCR